MAMCCPRKHWAYKRTSARGKKIVQKPHRFLYRTLRRKKRKAVGNKCRSEKKGAPWTWFWTWTRKLCKYQLMVGDEGSRENHQKFHRLDHSFFSWHFPYLSFYVSGFLDHQAIIWRIVSDEKQWFGLNHTQKLCFSKADLLPPAPPSNSLSKRDCIVF